MVILCKGEGKAKLFVKASYFARKNWKVHKVKQKSFIFIVWDSEQTGGKKRKSKDLTTHLITSAVSILKNCRIKTCILKWCVFSEYRSIDAC